MLRRHNHVRCAEKRIAAGGEHAQFVFRAGERKINLRALAPADPVALLRFDALDEIHGVKVVDQALGIGCDAQHPLAAHLLHNLAAAALAMPVHNLLVCKADLAGGAEVDRDLRLIGKAVLKELQEDPLRPFIIAGVGGVHLARPVKREAEALELAAEAGDVLLRDLCGVNARFDGVILRGQAKRVIAHREEDVIALHTALAADDVDCRVAQRVADVQPLPGRIRKLDEAVKLRLGMILACLKAARFLPFLLPFRLHGIMVIPL